MIVLIDDCRLELVQGDITTIRVDAIVNAANSALAGGGGVDGAIHRAAGPSIMEETRRCYPDGCPTGSAVPTGPGELPVKKIFHAVGPIWRGGHDGEQELLAATYSRCLELAREHDCRSIAFPAISTGVYGYPIDLAANTSLSVIRDSLVQFHAPEHVQIVLFSAGDFGAYARALEELTL